MELLLLQIESALKNHEYFVALMCTLALPDICGAIEKSNGKATKNRYISWYNTNMLDQRNLTATQCYDFRCRMLHQGISGYNQDSLEKKVIFIYPNNQIRIDNYRYSNKTKEAICIDLIDFCNTMISSVRHWEAKTKGSPNYIKNINRVITIHPNGIFPFIVGFPCIG